MAIAFDAATDGGNGASVHSFAHTCTGTDRILLVALSVDDGTVPTVTYNSVAMTEVSRTTADSVRDHFLFYLINPASGSNTVAVTNSAGTIFAGAASYTGAKQTGQPDSFATNTTASATTITGTTTVVASNCWLVGCGQADGGTSSGGTGTTKRAQYGGFPQFALIDSNATVATGAQSLVLDGNLSAAMNIIVASIAPAVAGGPANLKSYNTNLKANIKSINTNLIANVKSLNTNV